MQIRIALGGAALVVAFAGPAIADEDDVPLRDVPAAARTVIERETEAGVIEDIERDVSKDGTTYYQVEWEKDDVEWKLHVSADGKVLKRERDG